MTRFVVARRHIGHGAATPTAGGGDLRPRSGFGDQLHQPFGTAAPFSGRTIGLRATIVEDASNLPPPGPDLIIEPEILHWPEVIPPPGWPSVGAGSSLPLGTGPTIAHGFHVTGARQPLAHATVWLHARGPGGDIACNALTDTAGACTFHLPMGCMPVMVLVSPAGDFWPMVASGEELAAAIECPPLPVAGPVGWWHHAIGLRESDPNLGRGIRVGVIDSGAGPHPGLAHVTLIGAFIGGRALPPEQAADVGDHGSHVCGTIGARPAGTGHYAGIAPGCDLLVARVFKGPGTGASDADIANAIDALSLDHRADLINLSLGADVASQTIQDAIQEAADRGTLCICAAGNNSGPVSFPAAFPETVAVAALGVDGWAPRGSLSAKRLPTDPALRGRAKLYAANFTNHGPSIACIAPGVAILATVPNRHGDAALHAAMDGTSMASPVVCGTLAAILSSDPAYQALPRDAQRTQAARRALEAVLWTISLPPEYEGRGKPQFDVLFSA